MAKQLYDYWFVQFDFPDANGRPYKSSGGQMVWNDLLKRSIPIGWCSKKLSELIDDKQESISPADHLGTVYKHFSIPEYDNSGFYAEEEAETILSNKNTVSKNDVLVSKLNPWTSRVIWGMDAEDLICSTEFVTLAPVRSCEKGYMCAIAKSQAFINYCTKASTGTSHSHRRVNPDIMKMFAVPYCSEVVKSFSFAVSKLYDLIVENLSSIKELRKQRDTLMPLLLNGQASASQN